MLKNNLFISFLILTLFSCSTLEPKPKSPEIAFEDTWLEETGLFEQTFGIKIIAKNINDFALPITGMSYKISIDNIDFAAGKNNKNLFLEKKSSKQITLQLKASLLALAPKLGLKISDINKTNKRMFTYKIEGDIYTKLNTGTIPYKKEGEITIAELMSK